jgi:hypothetical protein
MKPSHKKDLVKLIKEHYPNHTANIEDIDVIGDGIMITGNGGKQVIYRIIDGRVRLYKMEESLKEADVSKWTSIIRQAKILSLE